jgi:hypothetical protein
MDLRNRKSQAQRHITRRHNMHITYTQIIPTRGCDTEICRITKIALWIFVMMESSELSSQKRLSYLSVLFVSPRPPGRPPVPIRKVKKTLGISKDKS